MCTSAALLSGCFLWEFGSLTKMIGLWLCRVSQEWIGSARAHGVKYNVKWYWLSYHLLITLGRNTSSWRTWGTLCLSIKARPSDLPSLLSLRWGTRYLNLQCNHDLKSESGTLNIWFTNHIEECLILTGCAYFCICQVRFGILEAGAFGVSQSRKRAFIWAASPEQTLPEWPEPMHVFSAPELKISLSQNMQYAAVRSTQNGAPYRAITVRDTIGDLPAVGNGASKINQEVTQIRYCSSFILLFTKVERKEYIAMICSRWSSIV